jgi:hypothetical protein
LWQHRELQLARLLKLFRANFVFGFQFLTDAGFGDHSLNQPRILNGQRRRPRDAHQQLFVLTRIMQVAQPWGE